MLNLDNEPIRLIIWDLDETFWDGTLTEGGIRYNEGNHKAVIELAKRGIMSSICSKNNFDKVKEVLVSFGIWDFFIFPSISWESKGPRLANLIEAVQLRPATVLFIDDNALNRNEALHFLPSLQVADEKVISSLLNSSLCAGTPDHSLARLAQYKVLETKHQDKAQQNDVTEFLRDSDIRVTISHDVEMHLDRAVELINRTNQLNFTKNRLSEDPQIAKADLQTLLNRFDVQAGLVHVRDKYGDYGFVGLYILRKNESQSTLFHFCFSCRTLGMGVERWIYERLGRPALKVVGEVLTDLSAPIGPIGWINNKFSTVSSDAPKLFGKILLRGGCGLDSMAHYLDVNADNVLGEFNTVRNDLHIRRDLSTFLCQTLEGLSTEAREAAYRFGLEADDFASALENEPDSFDACVFSFTNDLRFALYEHPNTGLRVPFYEFGIHRWNAWDDLTKFSAPEDLDRARTAGERKALKALIDERYVYIRQTPELFRDNLRKIMSRIPQNVNLFFLLEDEVYARPDGQELRLDDYKNMNQIIRDETVERQNTILLKVAEYVEHPHERINANHYTRHVYFRLYKKIVEILSARNQTKDNQTAHAD